MKQIKVAERLCGVAERLCEVTDQGGREVV